MWGARKRRSSRQSCGESRWSGLSVAVCPAANVGTVKRRHATIVMETNAELERSERGNMQQGTRAVTEMFLGSDYRVYIPIKWQECGLTTTHTLLPGPSWAASRAANGRCTSN